MKKLILLTIFLLSTGLHAGDPPDLAGLVPAIQQSTKDAREIDAVTHLLDRSGQAIDFKFEEFKALPGEIFKQDDQTALTLDQKAPQDSSDEETQKWDSTMDYLRRTCCGGNKVPGCYMAPNCLKDQLDNDGFKLRAECHWYGDSDTCNALQKRIETLAQNQEKIRLKLATRSKDLKENADRDKRKIKTFISEETQQDPFSVAAMAGSIALMQVNGRTTDFDDIEASKGGAQIKKAIEESIFAKYLKKQINIEFGFDDLRSYADKFYEVCGKIRTDNCPSLNTEAAAIGPRDKVPEPREQGSGPAQRQGSEKSH